MGRQRAKRRSRKHDEARAGRDRRWRRIGPLLILAAFVAGSAGVGVLSSDAASRSAAERRVANAEVRDTARRVLATRTRPSARAERARTIRRDLAELRSELAALAANPEADSGSRIEEIRDRIARRYVGEDRDQETLFDLHGEGPGAQMVQMVNDLGPLARNPQRNRQDVPGLIAEIDRALAMPSAEPTTVRTMMPLLPADAR